MTGLEKSTCFGERQASPERTQFLGILALNLEFRFPPDPARPPHRPAIFKVESRPRSAGKFSAAAVAVFHLNPSRKIQMADCLVIFLLQSCHSQTLIFWQQTFIGSRDFMNFSTMTSTSTVIGGPVWRAQPI